MIILRDYEKRDARRLQMLANNENVTRYMTTAFPYPYTGKDAEWWVSSGCNEGVVKVIEHNGEFVGSVGATPKTEEHSRTALIGYWIGESYWGKGLACEALKKLTTFMFSTTEIVRLEANIYSSNKPSMKVAEKAGYQKEAVLRRAVFKNGEYYDEYIYSRLK